MPDAPRPLPAVLRSMLEQLPPELRGLVEAKLDVVAVQLEQLGPALAAVEAGLEAAAPFLALEEAETQAADAAAATATETAERAGEQVRALSAAFEKAREAQAARWADAVAALVAMDDDAEVDLDRLARILDVDEVAATDEAFDAFMLDDDAPLVLGSRASRSGGATDGPRLERFGRRTDEVRLVDLVPHLARLTVPGTLADSPAGLWRDAENATTMLLGDGTRVRVAEGVLVREQDEIPEERVAPSRLHARRLAGGAPPLLMPHAAAGFANASACRAIRFDAEPHHAPAVLALGAAIELGDASVSRTAVLAEHVRPMLAARADPAAAAAAFLDLASDLYRVRMSLDPVTEVAADLPAIHVGQARWCALSARLLFWLPVLASDRTAVGGVDRPWTADPPSAAASWQAVSPAVHLDPDWVAPLVVVPGDPNVWAIDPDGEWWSLDVDYAAIVLARRAHCEPWLRALEGLRADRAKELRGSQQLAGAPPVESVLPGPASRSRLANPDAADQDHPDRFGSP